jgi:anaphase-promoting complex subunit 2
VDRQEAGSLTVSFLNISSIVTPFFFCIQGDIVPMLVNIYGSKSLFVKEYRKLLSDRLLLNQHFDTEEEIRNLEFLKIRFGESELHNCEVMLKDVADSKRINSHLQSVQDQPQVISS